MNLYLVSAAVAALVSFFVHTFLGGRYAAVPLLGANFPRAAIWLNYFTWHIVTVLLLILSATFLLAAVGIAQKDATLLASAIALSISALSVVITLKARIAVHRFPASYLLGTTALLGFLGVLL